MSRKYSNPSGLVIKAEYAPDEDRMLSALMRLLGLSQSDIGRMLAARRQAKPVKQSDSVS